LDALLCLPLAVRQAGLQGQGPALKSAGHRQIGRKSLLVTERRQRLGPLLHGLGLAQQLMEHRIIEPDRSRGIRVRDLLRQRQRRATPLQRLVRIPQHPQDVRQLGEPQYTEICSVASDGSVPLPRVVQGKGVLIVGAR
jgi:hypothetical protein